MKSSTSSQRPPIASGTGDYVADADALLGVVRGVGERSAIEIGGSEIEASYKAVLDEVVDEKQDQADRIENRLENMIEVQTGRLQQIEAHAPGMLARPGTRQKWQAQVAKAQATIQMLHERLETVREIKESVSVHGSRIETLAAQKLTSRDPQLADDFNHMQEARRLHEVHMRQQHEKEQKRSSSHDAPPMAGLGLSRSISNSRGSIEA